jgi:hypothetical protein
MKISQPEHGGNGVSARVVNQWLPLGGLGLPYMPVDLRACGGHFTPALCRFQTTCCSKSSLAADLLHPQMNLFDCATAQSFGACRGAKEICDD